MFFIISDFLEKNVSQILEHFQRYITSEICENDSLRIDASSRQHLQIQLLLSAVDLLYCIPSTCRHISPSLAGLQRPQLLVMYSTQQQLSSINANVLLGWDFITTLI